MDRPELLRKIYHFFGGMLLPTLYFFLDKGQMLPLAAAIAAVVLTFEILRIKNKAFAQWVATYIPIHLKEWEQHTFSGQAFMMMGCFLAILLVRKELAITALCFGALGDPSAALFGVYFGRHRLPFQKKKTWEGSIALIIVCALAGSLIAFWLLPYPPVILAVGVLAAAFFEVYNFRADDNFLIPFSAALCMEGATRLL